MRHTVSMFILLSAIWLANSGHYTGLLLTFGLLSVIFVLWLSHRMDVVDHESQPIELTPRLPRYYLWLFVKIIQGNIDVVKRIWSPASAISPCVRSFPLPQKSDMAKVIYANSITLTPGTIAINMTDDEVLVHSLTAEGLEEVEAGVMAQRVAALEK